MSVRLRSVNSLARTRRRVRYCRKSRVLNLKNRLISVRLLMKNRKLCKLLRKMLIVSRATLRSVETRLSSSCSRPVVRRKFSVRNGKFRLRVVKFLKTNRRRMVMIRMVRLLCRRLRLMRRMLRKSRNVLLYAPCGLA